MITVNDGLRAQLVVQNVVFVVLLLSITVLLGYFAWETRIQWNVSQNGRNSLSQASVEVLKQLDGPLTATVYASAQGAHPGNIPRLIRKLLSPYQRLKPDFVVTFIDPAEQPAIAHEAGVQIDGEMLVEFDGRRERLTMFNEQALTSLLTRLARSSARRVVALSGHGERKLDGIADRDLGEFGRQLTAQGFKTQALNIDITGDLPIDTSLLVISSPQADLPESAVNKVLAYIARGGNLLWLLDQAPLHGLQPLAEKLELTLTPGVVIDPQAQQLRVPITFAVGENYGQHPITRDFDNITVFPLARQITINDNEEWHSVSLVEAAQSGWVETGRLDKGIAFDPIYDAAGPVSIAAALNRTLQDREQRVAVVGSGYFLANIYLGQGKNLDFGINLVNWLAGDEEFIVIQPRATLDNAVDLNESTLTIIAWSFLIVLPLIFLASGVIIWWRRKKR